MKIQILTDTHKKFLTDKRRADEKHTELEAKIRELELVAASFDKVIADCRVPPATIKASSVDRTAPKVDHRQPNRSTVKIEIEIIHRNDFRSLKGIVRATWYQIT